MFVCLAIACSVSSCVPEGPATTEKLPEPTKTGATHTKPSPKLAHLPVRPPIEEPFEDTFDRAELGPDYNALSPAWKVVAGKLCVRGARNKGLWLLRKIPTNARIEFDAVSEAADGDIKVEAWGDGASGATGNSYTNATSYIAILGGWKNTRHVLARFDEHGEDRMELEVETGADDERLRPIAMGQPYRFKVERTNSKSVRMSVNDLIYFEFWDDEPLTGVGHEHFGFNNWDAPVCFDNLKITPL
ncbi:MAG: hypothetical protein IPK82_08530 [Polyangiaceae bacterium]|nr:hypothetical protein [Polyangiaceae bacterium]